MYDIDFFEKAAPLKEKILHNRIDPNEIDYLFDEFEKLRKSEPYVFNIETTNYCNMRCIMCPRTSLMTRKNVWVDDAAYEHVLDQITPHTPDALASALSALKQSCVGALWVVFGCGGDRDAGKRPEMGRIADSLADQLVVTNDNPRSESPEMIAEDILVGITGSACHIELDRGAAIRHAVLNARPGDTVLVAGKGHENYQLVGNNKLDFSDVSCAAEVLREREATHA